MITLTNNGRSPRGVHDVNGRCVVVEPGRSKSVNMDKATIELVRRMGALSIGATQEADDADTDLDQLRAQAESLGVTVDKRWKEKRLLEEIEKATQEADDAVHGTDSGTTEDEVPAAE